MSSSVISVTASNLSDANSKVLNEGNVVAFTLVVDAPVQVTAAADGSTPALVLSNGALASYVGTSADGTALTFGYTVAAGDDTTDLQVTDLDLNGAAINTLGSASTFQAPQQHNTGLGPESVVVKDVNGDGNADLVTANYRSATVSVVLSDGVGGFGDKADFATGSGPESVVVEDVNGDGNTDLVIANVGSASVSVLLGDGVGGFSAKTDFTTGSPPGSVAVADVNADGKADLVTANSGDTVSVLLGDGLGGFVRTDFAAGARPEAVAVADVNGDGNLDLVTANSYNGTASVLLGDGLGGFSTRTDYATGNNSRSVVVMDVNGDGSADLLVANTDSNTVSVLLNNGLGSFGVKTDYATSVGPRSVAAADVDGDGNLDLVTANSASDTVSILLGDGVGGFSTKRDLATGDNPFSVAVADVDGDGRADLVTANVNSSTVSVLLGTGTPLDASGLAGLAGSDTDLEIDTIAPSAPSALAIAPGSDSGIADDGVTNDATPTLTGTAEAGSTVALFDGASLLGTVLSDDNGQWSFIPGTALAEGGHSITAAATDAAGNVSAASAALALTIDTVLPSAPSGLALALASDSGVVGDGVTNVSKPVITGSGVVGDTVTLFDGTTLVGATTVAGDGTWSVAPAAALADGSHTLTTTQTDAAGNVSAASAALPLTIDTVLPSAPSALTLASDSGVVGDRITDDATPTLTGTAEAGSNVTLTDGASVLGTALADGAGQWSFTPTTALFDGPYSITAISTDAAGNVSAISAALPLTIDSTALLTPVNLALASASDSGTVGDGITSDSTPTLTGTAEARSTVTLTDASTGLPVLLGTALANGAGQWSLTPTTALADGAHGVTATATDAAGNVSLASTALALTIDTAIPAVLSALTLEPASDSGILGDGITSDGTPTLTGNAETGSTVTLTDGASVLGTVQADGTGQWSFTPTIALADGAYGITATQADAAGNVSLASATLPLTIDSAVPAAPARLALASVSDSGTVGDGRTSDSTPTLTGSAEAGSTVAVFDGASLLGTVLADSTGQWGFTPDTALAEGGHSITTVATDAAGNVSAASAALVLTIDTAVPVPTVGGQIPNGNTPTLSGKGVPGSTVTLLANGVVTGSAVADAATGLFEVTPDTPLVLGLNRLTTTQSTASGTSVPSAPVVLFVVQAPERGISTTGFSSADIGGALDQGARLAFIDGTEAMLLTDATLSVGANTNQATLQRLYQGLLGHGNDTAGITYWDDQLNDGVSKAVVAAGFLTTDEYLATHSVQTDEQFVTSLYQGLLGRVPEQEGLAAWTGALTQGASRGDVTVSIADSGEAKSHLAPITAQVYVPNDAGTLTHVLYETGLGREVELPALAFWKGAYEVLTPPQIAALIAGSTEFTAYHAGQSNDAFVESLYQAGLGRPAEASGLASWTTLLSSGSATRADVLLAIAISDEAHAHLTDNLSGAPIS